MFFFFFSSFTLLPLSDGKKRHQLKKRIFDVLILIISKKQRESTTSTFATRHLSLLFEMRKFIWHIWSDARVSVGGGEWCTSYNNNQKKEGKNTFLISRCSIFKFSFVYFIFSTIFFIFQTKLLVVVFWNFFWKKFWNFAKKRKLKS